MDRNKLVQMLVDVDTNKVRHAVLGEDGSLNAVSDVNSIFVDRKQVQDYRHERRRKLNRHTKTNVYVMSTMNENANTNPYTEDETGEDIHMVLGCCKCDTTVVVLRNDSKLVTDPDARMFRAHVVLCTCTGCANLNTTTTLLPVTTISGSALDNKIRSMFTAWVIYGPTKGGADVIAYKVLTVDGLMDDEGVVARFVRGPPPGSGRR
ncbi:hypothetical protein AYL99_11880 [Fonsecaea erecta]|uniref:Uncharacterized protein n=1 Tax=Fonsecaea erecta TaxID=1367422 RepID=A0A178Z230_9EURO|nr:hypothetical protein AYL99_11880 [Fonsecaea erecta]OAP53858.1 hypothetical protein AYL99_11880 [Fonsecaea erecta]